jgi:hypothetical protein
MAAFLNGPPITDKKKNAMDEPQRGLYVTVTINLDDFQGINDSGESFLKVWVEKDYDEKVLMVALDDHDEPTALPLMILLICSPTS